MSTTSTYTVTGMTCGHCVRSVKDEVQRIDGVSRVEVDLTTGVLTVESQGRIDDEVVTAAVEEAGYQVLR